MNNSAKVWNDKFKSYNVFYYNKTSIYIIIYIVVGDDIELGIAEANERMNS